VRRIEGETDGEGESVRDTLGLSVSEAVADTERV